MSCRRFLPAQLTGGLLCLILLFAGSARAQGSDLAHSVIRNSALTTVIDQYPKMLTQGVVQGLSQTGNVDPLVKGAISGMIGQAFNSASIRRELAADLDSGMSEAALGEVNDWYQSPLGREVTMLERAAALPVAWREIEKQGPMLAEKYEGTERAKLFADFDRASRATESAVDTAVAVQTAFGTAMAAFNGAVVDVEAIRKRVESQRPMLRGVVEQQVYTGYLYTYEALSVDQLRSYIQFMETSEGSQFNKVVTGSVHDAIIEPIETIGAGLARLFGPSGQ